MGFDQKLKDLLPRSDVAAVSWQNQRTLTDRDPATGEPIRWRALGQKETLLATSPLTDSSR